MGAAGVGAIIQGVAEMGGNMINAAGLELERKQLFRNLGYQSKAQLLNLALQKAQWNREDTAIQRRVNDLKAAGLSPVLAAGQGASSSTPMRVEPQHGDFRFPYNAISTPDIAGMITNLLLTQSQIQKNTAETARIEQQTKLDLLNNPEKLRVLKGRADVLREDTFYRMLENAFFRETGIGRSSSELGRTAVDFTKIIDSVIRSAIGNQRGSNNNNK